MKGLVSQNSPVEDLLSTLIDAIPDLICFKDGEGRWLKANEYTLKMYGVSEDIYQNRTDSELAELYPLYSEFFNSCLESDQEAWERKEKVKKVEQLTRGDQVFLLDVTKIPLFHEDGSRKGLLVFGRDITEQKKTEAQLHHLAEHDSLTGLPNRRCFQTDIQARLTEAQKKEETLALLYLDIDNFKKVNDTLGHTVGDILLQQVSNRLSNSFTRFTVYRIGGDEFTILLPQATRQSAIHVAKMILQQFKQPYLIRDHSLHIRTSIGIGLFPFDGIDMDTLVSHADTAMYRAKESGNGFEFYQKEMDQKLSRALEIEKELRYALEQKELQVYYQPKISLATQKLLGFEALSRWSHPTLGSISPAEFIPLAEENGMILPLTEWVMNTACEFLKNLQNDGFPDLHMSVNLSPFLFQRAELMKLVTDIVFRTGIWPNSLELEITESVMKDHQRALKTLQKMKTLGLRVAVDDFGTGYSSLNYLIQLPIDTLKIDQSFIKNIEKKECAAIVKTIIDMAHHVNLNVIAEGVETLEQVDFLRQHGCVEGQGYYFGRPLAPQDVMPWILNHIEKAKA